MFCLTIGLTYILWFIAGHKALGAVHAIIVVVKKSSAMPTAILPMTFAVAGHTINKSAASASAMCSTFHCFGSSNICMTTGLLDMVLNVIGATSFAALSVIMTWVSAQVS